ncbi:dTDP-4-dehydrorhamnose reductase [Alkalicoccus urumqiensis]|uniref:dTDP-4-dehydrorhamnose reductase n=1 Tax=Alkalicoccus urumqiensis TaxID=1548213 RepID=A0A2P6MHU0_ALKUR|nr:dTDP-4-dehydrorhamnose reductase [Alkalicoccus urumqiensis]PRO65841.1 dTDP-4-dehydrorhamnose reductase [Alkalicoccus urumqiensis]
MKVLVTGAGGQVGHDVMNRLQQEQIKCIGTTREELDITDETKTKNVLKKCNPDVVIHCAAYTAVDKAEDEKELCCKVNVQGTRHVAKACKEIDAKMVYISTDYVFNGEGEIPFEVTDQPDPINYYGQTKYEGELEVQDLLEKYFIVRISWVFGENGNNFVKTMLRLGKERGEISVVSDQIGSPTYTYDLAKLLVEMIQTDRFGIYHATNEGYCSWYGFSKEIFRLSGMQVKVNEVASTEYPTPAKRPLNSRMSKEILYKNKLPHWEEGLKHFMNQI